MVIDVMVKMSKTPYYSAQIGWSMNDYYYLNRFLARLVRQEAKREAEVRAIDVDLMTNVTKILFICVLVSSNNIWMFEKYPNLLPLKKAEKLESKLTLVDVPHNHFPIYQRLGVEL